MSENNENEVVEPRITVVTSENFDQYVNKQMGIDPEAEAAKELEKIEAAKAEKEAIEKSEDDDPTSTLDEHVPKEKKNRLQERFSKLTADRKAAEEKAQKAAEEAAKLRAEAEEARKLANELKQKYEPPKELGEKPKPEQFTDVAEFAKALEDYTAEKTLREDAEKKAKQAIEAEIKQKTETWSQRQQAFKQEAPDYEQVISQASDLMVSPAIQEALMESEFGPALQYYFAKNKDVAQNVFGMSDVKAIKEIVKLENELAKGKAEPKGEVSQAPAPISPLKNAGSPVSVLKGSEEVPKGMSYSDWKAKRQAGQIR